MGVLGSVWARAVDGAFSAFAGGDISMVLVVEGEKPAKGMLGIALKRCNCVMRVSLEVKLVHGQRVSRGLDKIQWIWIGIGKLLFKGMAD